MANEDRAGSRLELPLFFLLAFAITWAAQITAYVFAYNNGLALSNEANYGHFLNFLRGRMEGGFAPYFLLYQFSFGPTLAGIIVTALFHGRAGLRRLWSELTRVRIPWKWYALALAIPLGLNLVSLALGYVMGGMQPVQYSFLVPLAQFVPFLLFLIVFTGLAEEIGWRGYALPELQKRHSAEKSSWILGVLWGLWHLPANFVIPYLRGELSIPFVVIILVALTAGIAGWTIVLTWFYNNTRSLFLIILIHGLSNALQSYLILSSNNQMASLLFTLLPWVVAAYLLKRYGGETLMGRERMRMAAAVEEA